MVTMPWIAYLILGVGAVNGQAPEQPPLLLRSPTISDSTIVFQFAGDLWSVPRSGGRAQRLTTAPGVESDPRFSPDGKWIAFSAQYDGNTDAFVVPAAGGVPKRLTAHPSPDRVTGWTPDGKSVLFTSAMASQNTYSRLFSVSATGGVPKPLPFPAVDHAEMSPDGTRIAYVPNPQWQAAWRRYRGGQTTPIWVADLADSKWREIPRKNTNDKMPMWLGDSIYYLSDPQGPVGLYRFDIKTGRTQVEVPGSGFDIKSASAGSGVIVYEKLGGIWIFDPKTRATKKVPIELDGDFPEVRPQLRNLATGAFPSGISPTGQRVVGTTRGFVFTAPASRGDARLIPGKEGFLRTDPAWSPDGKTIAYITPETGKEQLALLDLATQKTRLVALGDADNAFDSPLWSPDSKEIAYRDNALNLWVLDVESGKSTKVDRNFRRSRVPISASWSPDSKWLAYQKDLPNSMGAVFLYQLESAKATQVTDGLSDARNPVFDRDGKHLFFLASTDVGLGAETQDIAALSSANATQNVYGIVLKKGGANPLQPQSDEEPLPKEPEAKPADAPKPPATTATPQTPKAPEPPKATGPITEIDLDGIAERIFTVPLPRQPYSALGVGAAGNVLVIASPTRASGIDFAPGGGRLLQYSFASRESTTLASGVFGFEVSANGQRMLLSTSSGNAVVPVGAPVSPGQGQLNISSMTLRMDPPTEWRTMFWEAIRNQKIRFYDPGIHGVDLDALGKKYEPFLAGIRSRDDLNYLFEDLFAEICVGHMFIGGGEIPGSRFVAGGLLGADYTFENGRYKLARVYNGERWNPGLFAPLAQPGVEAKAGEYLLSIDGEELTDVLDLYLMLEGKAGRQVRIKLGPNPDGTGSREAVVLPIANEGQLRFRAWTEDNRRRVEEATGGRVGYVHVPDTATGGWREFMRYYYAQSGKDAIIIDERHNGGGFIADFLVREMMKDVVAFSRTRHGEDFIIPPMGVYGPKVMIANEMAGSGGDILPWLFRFHKVGPIIGKRTWGAMISNYGFGLADGGFISSPDDAMYDPNGKWIIENVGTPPDIEVELDPFLWRQGKDAQLEAAIKEIQRLLAANPPKRPKRPDYPSIPPFRPGR
jgi:tricorn protease